MMAFKLLIDQDALSSIKVATNAIESECFLSTPAETLILIRDICFGNDLSWPLGKNFAHRIYIGNHIYADLTLLFQKGAFQSLPWTYPDHKAPQLQSFLYQVRNKYIKDVTELEL